MTFCLNEKFNQNYVIKNKLIETYPKPLVEYSEKDHFWGASKNEAGKFVGKNTLGKLLMKLRLELKIQQNLLCIQRVKLLGALCFVQESF